MLGVEQSQARDYTHLLCSREEALAEKARRNLHSFVQQAWHVIEAKPFQDNWHIGAICAHVQAVIEGDIRDLLINVPPRTSKSTCEAVMGPAWSWIDHPGLQWLTVSYGQGLSTRDAVKSRRILDSPWFQRCQVYWGTDLCMAPDQNQKHRYENIQTGYRLSTSIGGKGTGEGGDIISMDDLHNVAEADSDTKRNEVLTWLNEVMPTRRNDPEKSCRILTMQRVHEEDASGHELEKGGWVHLNLPMRHEPVCCVEIPHQCSLKVADPDAPDDAEPEFSPTPLGFTDPRYETGEELLDPNRYPETAVVKLEEDLGDYAAVGQLQQRPTPRTGGMFNVTRFRVEDVLPAGVAIVNKVRSWDKAATQGGGAWTVGTLMAELEDNPIAKYWILDVVREQLATRSREELIQHTAAMDGDGVYIVMEQEGGSAGIDSIEESMRGLDGYMAEGMSSTGDKVLKARPYSVQVNASNVALIRGKWNKLFIAEHKRFPRSTKKDQVDSAAQAYRKLRSLHKEVQVF